MRFFVLTAHHIPLNYASFLLCSFLQSWPSELPLVSGVEGDEMAMGELNTGVVVYSCSFAVILLMILSQVVPGGQRNCFSNVN
jgi:hypothetical protein